MPPTGSLDTRKARLPRSRIRVSSRTTQSRSSKRKRRHRPEPVTVLCRRGVGHPGVHRFQGLATELGVLDGARRGCSPQPDDQVLVRDATLVQPRDPRRTDRSSANWSRPRSPLLRDGSGRNMTCHRRSGQPVDRHALLGRHVAQQVVGHEVGEHLAAVHPKARIGRRAFAPATSSSAPETRRANRPTARSARRRR